MFIFDFDDTLFDTHAFKHARLEDVTKLGISSELYWETYKEARKSPDGLFTYSNERHAKMLGRQGFEESDVLSALEKTTSDALEGFLFPGAIKFLDYLKSIVKPMILLSLGDPSMQELKVRGSGIHDYFDRVFFVTATKAAVLKELFDSVDEGDVWFINDKPDETVKLKKIFQQMNIVLKKSSSIKEEEYKKSGLSYFDTLKEIEEYVREKI